MPKIIWAKPSLMNPDTRCIVQLEGVEGYSDIAYEDIENEEFVNQVKERRDERGQNRIVTPESYVGGSVNSIMGIADKGKAGVLQTLTKQGIPYKKIQKSSYHIFSMLCSQKNGKFLLFLKNPSKMGVFIGSSNLVFIDSRSFPLKKVCNEKNIALCYELKLQ